jgi:hypothetical protein
MIKVVTTIENYRLITKKYLFGILLYKSDRELLPTSETVQVL